MSDPLISIIVPIYNVERYLEKCLDSLNEQTYNNIEIICIIDGSPDRSTEIATAYENRDCRFRTVIKKNGGRSSARNLGLDIAKGDYVLFVDGDDWIEKNTCEIVISKMVEERCDLVMWTYVREYIDASRKKVIYKNDCTFDEKQCNSLHRRIIGLYQEEWSNPANADALAPVCTKLFKRSIIEEHNLRFVDTDVIGPWEDGLFNLYYLEYTKRAAYINEPLYHYRKGIGVTSKYNENLQYFWNYRQQYLKSYIEDHKLDNTYLQCLHNRNAWNLVSLSLNFMCLPQKDRYQAINNLLKGEALQEDIKRFPTRYLPLHWKVLYIAAKVKCTPIVYLLFAYMKKVISN